MKGGVSVPVLVFDVQINARTAIWRAEVNIIPISRCAPEPTVPGSDAANPGNAELNEPLRIVIRVAKPAIRDDDPFGDMRKLVFLRHRDTTMHLNGFFRHQALSPGNEVPRRCDLKIPPSRIRVQMARRIDYRRSEPLHFDEQIRHPIRQRLEGPDRTAKSSI